MASGSPWTRISTVMRPDHGDLRVHVPGHGDGVFVDAAIFVVFDDADDGHGVTSIVGADGVAEGIVIGQEAPGEFFIDDADGGGVRGVGVGEIAAGKDGHAERGEEIRPGDVAAHGSGCAVGDVGQSAVDPHVAVVGPPGSEALLMTVTDSTPGSRAGWRAGRDRRPGPRESRECWV